MKYPKEKPTGLPVSLFHHGSRFVRRFPTFGLICYLVRSLHGVTPSLSNARAS